MRLRDDPPLHLTYCLNIHPGETWDENFAAIRDHATRVREIVAPERPFGLGLRLSARAAAALAGEENLDTFKRFLAERDLYVFTVNAFPYGAFHGTRVKADVYRPDWMTDERIDYTNTVADILAELLPEGVDGSISTVPGSYARWVRSEEDVKAIARNLGACAEHLARLRDRTGRFIALALEPEPDCLLATIDQFIRFYRDPLRRETDFDAASRHIGICVDACHLAMEFDDLPGSLRQLKSLGIPVPKVQLSAALRCSPTPEALARLAEFRDPVYLHQVRVRRTKGDIAGHPDLDIALASERPEEPGREEWRIHFHVPLFFEGVGELGSTASTLESDIGFLVRNEFTSHLEIETYTFSVLPEALRDVDVVESIAKEYEWVLRRLGPFFR